MKDAEAALAAREKEAQAMYIMKEREAEAMFLQRQKEAEANYVLKAREAEANFLAKKKEAEGLTELSKVSSQHASSMPPSAEPPLTQLLHRPTAISPTSWEDLKV